MKKYDVVCVGFAVQDIVLSQISGDALKRDSTYAKSTLVSAGGDAVNQAVVLSQLGKKTALIAAFGRDPVGLQIENDLKSHGVDITWSVRERIERTGLSVAVIQEGGQRSFLVGPGKGNIDISFSHIPLEILGNTKAISLGSLFCLKELDGNGAVRLFRKAKENGVLTFADMTADAYGIGAEGVKDIYPYTDYLMPSFEEAVYVTGKTNVDEIAEYFLGQGVSTLVLKLGSRGCFVKSQKKRFFTDSFEVNAVDTTGCGDAFCAGFITGILDGMTLEECAEYAAAAGALNAQTSGAHEAVKCSEQVFRFMQQTKKNSIL